MILNFRMEVPEGPSYVDPVELLNKTVSKPLSEFVAKFQLGSFKDVGECLLSDDKTVCAFYIRSFYSYMNSVMCYFEKDGSARFVRLTTEGHANILAGSWTFVVYMIIPFLQELATAKQKMKKQSDVLEMVAETLKQGMREIL